MGKASDNPFPSILVVEGSAPATPTGGDQRLFVDMADHLLKMKDSTAAVTPVGGAVADIVDLPAAETDTGKRLAPDGAGGVAWGTGGGGSGIEVTDGVHDVTGATSLTVTGATVGGTTPNATLTVTGGGGGPTLVGYSQVVPDNSGDSSFQIYARSPLKVGNILILAVFNPDGTALVSSVAQNAGTVTWSHIDGVANSGGDNCSADLWMGVIGAGASARVNVSMAGYTRFDAILMEFDGLTGTIASHGAVAANSGSTLTLGPITSSAGQLVVALLGGKGAGYMNGVGFWGDLTEVVLKGANSTTMFKLSPFYKVSDGSSLTHNRYDHSDGKAGAWGVIS